MKTKLTLIFVILMTCAGIAYSEDVLISSGNQSYPPSSWQEGEAIVGVAAELTQMIFADLGIKAESKYVGPWKRVQKEANDGKIDVITTIYKNKEREEYLDYPQTPYMDDPNVIWVWKGKRFPFEKKEDLIGKKGLAVLGDSYGEEFDKFIAEKLTIERAAELLMNFKKLQAERGDYMPYGLHSGIIAAKQYGYDGKLEYLPKPLLSEGMYIAISKKSKFRKYLPELEKGIRKYKADGTIEKLIQKHIDLYVKSQKKSD